MNIKFISSVIIAAMLVSIVSSYATYFIVTKTLDSTRESELKLIANEFQLKISDIQKRIPPTISSSPFLDALPIESPLPNWKTISTNNFSFQYPSNYAVKLSAINIVEIPNLIYIEQSSVLDGCLNPSSLREMHEKHSVHSVIRYFSDSHSYFSGSPKSQTALKQGILCNFDNTETITFQYPSIKEATALTILDSLRMVVGPWNWGTRAKVQ